MSQALPPTDAHGRYFIASDCLDMAAASAGSPAEHRAELARLFESLLLERLAAAGSPAAAAKAYAGSVYHGDLGLALLLHTLHISPAAQAALEHAQLLSTLPQGSLAATSQQIVTAALPTIHPRRQASFLEGRAGGLALQSVLSPASSAALDELLELQPTHVATLDRGECEVLYGRAGYLYALLFVRAHTPDSAVHQRLRPAVQAVVAHLLAEGRRGGTPRLPLAYSWHGKQYLGGAHGVAGILLMLLQAHELFPAAGLLPEPALVLVLATVDALLEHWTFPSGNLRSSVESSSRDKLVQWCHGAPGMMHLLLAARRACADIGDPNRGERYLTAAFQAADVIFARGLLAKGVGLCHGICGGAFCLLALHRATGDHTALARARAFAAFATAHLAALHDIPSRPLSLFEGDLALVALHAALADPTGPAARFPAYDLLS